jgi:streptogramin lyase
VATIHVPSGPHGATYASGALWVGQHYSANVARVDPGTNTVVAHVFIPSGQPARSAAGPEGLWHLPYSGSGLYRIDPTTNRVVAEATPPGENCCVPSVGAGSVWVPKGEDGIYRVDASSGEVVAHIPIAQFEGAMFGFGSLWGKSGGDVFRLDPATNSIVGRIPVAGLAEAEAGLSVGAGALWVTVGNKVARIDPSTSTVALIAVPGTASFVTATDDAVWVVGQSQSGLYDYSKLWRIDPTANKVTAALSLPNGDIGDLAIGAGSLWITLFSKDKLLRIQPAAAR